MKAQVPHRNILMSIKPQYTSMIYAGTKTYEFRRRIPRDIIHGDTIYIYETSPTMMITGCAKVKRVIKGRARDVWATTKATSGLTEEAFMKYFKPMHLRRPDIAYAIELCDVYHFEKPWCLVDVGKKRAPQSWYYLNSGADPRVPIV